MSTPIDQEIAEVVRSTEERLYTGQPTNIYWVVDRILTKEEEDFVMRRTFDITMYLNRKRYGQE